MISPQYDHTDLPQLNNFHFNGASRAGPSTIVPTYGAGRAGADKRRHIAEDAGQRWVALDKALGGTYFTVSY